MSRLASRADSLSPVRRAGRTPTIVVVDARPADFEGWPAAAESGGAHLHIVASASEALRIARTTGVDLWVMNAVLDGLGGCELCSLVRQRDPRATVYLMADEYSEALERQALQARATLFGVKSANTSWLSEWLSVRNHSAT